MRSIASRVRGFALVVLLGSALALSGCARADPDPPGETGGGPFPVVVPTAFGDVTIPDRPRRVVALGWGDADTALALGVQPVGSADWLDFGGAGLGPWMPEPHAPMARLGTTDVSVEQIAALEPDLILDTRSSGQRERHDQLAQLGVPVIEPPAGADAYLTTWQDQLDLVGKALGRPAEAARLRTDLDGKVRRVAEQHPEFHGATVAMGARTNSSYGAYVDGASRVDFMRSLGFVNSPAIQREARSGQFSVPLSAERLDLLNADLTVMFPINVDAGVLSGDPLYRSVPSVRAGRSVVLANDPKAKAISSGSVPGLSYALDETVPMFASALAR